MVQRNKRPILPPAVLEFFRQQGAKGGRRAREVMTAAERQERARKAGRVGGKRSLVTMTAAERQERARKAVAARERKRQTRTRKAKGLA
jgi:hypothetical protein